MVNLRYRLPYGRQRLMKDWIKALRSGKYKQCPYFTINTKGESCAIGVLGIVACDNPHNGYEVCKKFLKISDTLVCSKNDRNESFSQIADWLERDYL